MEKKLRVRIVLLIDVDRDEYAMNYGSEYTAKDIREDIEDVAVQEVRQAWHRRGLPATANSVRTAEKS